MGCIRTFLALIVVLTHAYGGTIFIGGQNAVRLARCDPGQGHEIVRARRGGQPGDASAAPQATKSGFSNPGFP